MDKIGEQLPAVGTALAAIILVFLGAILAAFDSFDAEQQGAVRLKYRLRARMAFSSLLTSVASAGFGLVGIGNADVRANFNLAGCILLGLSFILMITVALLAVLEI